MIFSQNRDEKWSYSHHTFDPAFILKNIYIQLSSPRAIDRSLRKPLTTMQTDTSQRTPSLSPTLAHTCTASSKTRQETHQPLPVHLTRRNTRNSISRASYPHPLSLLSTKSSAPWSLAAPVNCNLSPGQPSAADTAEAESELPSASERARARRLISANSPGPHRYNFA